MLEAILWIIGIYFVIQVIKAFLRASNFNRNKANGDEIRALCIEKGVPASAYHQIVVHKMDEAKKIAMKMGEVGEDYFDTSWNKRLALAICAIYANELTKTEEST